MFSGTVTPEAPYQPEVLKRRRGRPSKVDQYPEIIKIVEDAIKQHGTKAQERRRDTTDYLSNGLTCKQLKQIAEKEIPGLQIGRKTISRMLIPPNKAFASSERYKSYINAKIPHKRNDLNIVNHPDTHLCRSLVYQTLELGFKHMEETVVASCDNKVTKKWKQKPMIFYVSKRGRSNCNPHFLFKYIFYKCSKNF